MQRRTNWMVVLLLLGALAGAALGQPPRVREPGELDLPGPPETVPEGPDIPWPQTRQPGEPNTDAPEGQRRLHAEVRPGPEPMPLRRPRTRWYMGIYPERAPLGLRVSSVVPGSPAYRAGLERGDYLLDINGYVVGGYRGSYYPLDDALAYFVRPDGWVNVRVWNKRTGNEEVFWMRLARR